MTQKIKKNCKKFNFLFDQIKDAMPLLGNKLHCEHMKKLKNSKQL